MSGTPSPEERQQNREANVLDRRNESNETKDGITQPLHMIDGSLLDSIDDPDARQAVESMVKGYAHLSELVTGRDPPEQEPYGWWHRDIQISDPTLVNKTDTAIEASVTLEVHKWFDKDATVEMRVSEINVIDGEEMELPEKNDVDGLYETVNVSAVEGDNVTLEVTSLDPDTKYSVRFSAECDDIGDYGSSIIVTTDV